jgi:hypothetical protein
MRSGTACIGLGELVAVGGIGVGVPVGAGVLAAVSVAVTVGVTAAGSNCAGWATGLQAVAKRIERITKKKDFPFFALIISAFLRLIGLFIIVRWNNLVEKQLVTKSSSLRGYIQVPP